MKIDGVNLIALICIICQQSNSYSQVYSWLNSLIELELDSFECRPVHRTNHNTEKKSMEKSYSLVAKSRWA